jgi:hypothetical protein
MNRFVRLRKFASRSWHSSLSERFWRIGWTMIPIGVAAGSMNRFVRLRKFASRSWHSSLAESLWRISWPMIPIGVAASLLVSPNLGNPDSAVMATQTLNDFVLPHWPPLYPLFIRTINFLTGSVLWLLGGSAPGFVEPTFNWIALKLILLIQHGLAIGAAAYVALQFRLSLTGRRCVAAVLYLNPFTLSSIHSLLSEAPTTIFLLMALGSAVPILLYGDWGLNRVAWFFVWIALATLSRYAAIAFAFLLPAGLAWQAICEWLSHRTRIAHTTLKRMAIALIGVVCAQIAVSLIADKIMLWRDVEPRSSLGRAFVYRLAEGSLSKLPGDDPPGFGRVFMTRDEHADLIRRLKASTTDKVLLQTIDIVASTPEYSWVPAFNRVDYKVTTCASCCKHVRNETRCQWAETDRRLNQVAWLALLRFDPVLMRDAALRTGEILAPFFVRPPFYPDPAWFSWKGLSHSWKTEKVSTERFDAPAMSRHFRWHLGTDFRIVINLAQQLRGIMVLAAIGLLTILLPFARKAIPLCLGLLSAVIAHAVMISLVTVYIPRYGLPVDLSALFAVLVAIISTYETRWRTSPVKQSEDFQLTGPLVR